MRPKSLVLSSFESYLAYENDVDEVRGREERIRNFPHAVMVELAYPELDNAERWYWRQFGPMDGECMQKQSEYRVCFEENAHRHSGRWTSHWFAKTNYNFGYNELYFAEKEDFDSFLAHLPEIDFGEAYEK